MATNNLKYLATINGIVIGMFISISEAETAASNALGRGFPVSWEQGKQRVLEIRDISLSYQLVSTRKY